MAVLLALLVVSVMLARMGLVIALHLKSLQMKRREKDLLAAGIRPVGTTLRHGMTVDPNDPLKVRSSSVTSAEWYSRLV